MSGISINPYSNLYEQTATSAQNASASRLNVPFPEIFPVLPMKN